MVKFAVFILCGLVFAVVQSKRLDDGNRDEYQRKWMIVGDEENKLHFIDLTQEIKKVYLADSEVSFYYYSRKTKTPVISTVGNSECLKGTDFDIKKPTMFIVHGWNNDHGSKVNTLIKEAVLDMDDWNIFVVDWSSQTKTLYAIARAAVPEVGRIMSAFIKEVMGDSLSTLRLIGHSLGAHVCGKAGQLFGGRVPSIVGLDPALPYFLPELLDERLDTTDAQYVEVIHTCAGFLGFKSPIGHSDYYPNGGAKQAGCGLDVIGTCSHSRAYMYYAESIKGGEFNAFRCQSYEDFQNSQCNDNPEALMGELQLDESKGTYYLNTNSEAPFAMD